MAKTLHVAAAQMDVAPAPTTERLTRAQALVARAADAGARVVVLPELFNTGYAYDDANYQRAEPLHGPTVAWMTETAHQYNLYLAGALLLLDEARDEIYNTLLLIGPDGQRWRYDKRYPWGWERAYFRAGHGITVAETKLGRFGMLICWDVAHRDLWQRYAGKVDLMLISSCPPNLADPTYILPDDPDDYEITAGEMGPIFKSLRKVGPRVFVDLVAEQAAWLNVPVIGTSGAGQFESIIPQGRATMAAMLPFAPHLLPHLPGAKRLRVRCDMLPATQIVDADGAVVAACPQDAGETVITATVALPDVALRPLAPQPPARVPWLSYAISDVILPGLTRLQYRRRLRRTYGHWMAPLDTVLRNYALSAAAAMILTFLLGLLLGRWSKRAK